MLTGPLEQQGYLQNWAGIACQYTDQLVYVHTAAAAAAAAAAVRRWYCITLMKRRQVYCLNAVRALTFWIQ